MPFDIIDLSIFSRTQDRLKAVTEANLAELKPGEPIPEGAIEHGVMSPTLKALLWVRNQAIMAAHEEFGKVAKTPKQNVGDLAELLAAEEVLESERNLWNRLFWLVLRSEFPKLTSDPVSYGPNFEVYQMKPSVVPTVSVILLGGKIDH